MSFGIGDILNKVVGIAQDILPIAGFIMNPALGLTALASPALDAVSSAVNNAVGNESSSSAQIIKPNPGELLSLIAKSIN
jgi:hypothetical protein